jgi:hypothetical protein
MVYPGKSSQPQMNADKREYSMRFLYLRPTNKVNMASVHHGMIHLR